MQRVNDVIELNGDLRARETPLVLGLNRRWEVKAGVVEDVEKESRDIKRREVQIIADDTLAPEVTHVLRPERGGPHQEVDPTHHLREHRPHPGTPDAHAHEGVTRADN